MDRTNAPGHVNHLFVAEDPATNRPPTELVPEDFNAHQEELMAVIEAAEIVPSANDLGQVLAALQVLFVGKSTYQEQEAGQLAFYARSTAPSGYLKANGAAVSVAAYPNLSNAIYVGDADNATAQSGYKCTDPLNPSTTRDIAGAYIVLPDMRGEFPRGWDDGRGIDAGRVLGSAQGQDIQPHTHAGVVTTLLGNNGGTGAGTQEIPSYGSTSSTGTTETRPRNIAWLACIKF